MKYIFIGNRKFVLDKMEKLNCEITKIFAVKDSYLEKYLIENKREYEIITSKKELIEKIKKLDFDCLVSNGCPYILPISQIKKENQKFINIHPSLLPDLKGKHPINGALLFNRKHGVTCHFMDDGIDTGNIIEQIEIPITDDINLDLLYQISFRMEGEVFEKALKNNFKKIDYSLYYSRKAGENFLKKEDSLETIYRKIRAFGTKGMFAIYKNSEKEYHCISAKIIENISLNILFGKHKNNKIILKYGNFILVKLENKYLEILLEEENTISLEKDFL